MRFEWKNYVDIHDEDMNGVARASAVLRYMQSAAWEHMRVAGPSGKDLQEQGKAFIVSAIDLTIHTPIHAYQTLTAKTWACRPRALTFPRGYALYNEDGDAVAEAGSQWALVDLTTRSLLRPSELGADYEAEDEVVRVSRFSVPHPEDMEMMGKYTVRYSETDYIGHLTNTRYPDLFTTFLPMKGKYVSHICIHFLHEAPLGEKLTVYCKKDGDRYLMLSMRSDGQINADAEVTLADIDA